MTAINTAPLKAETGLVGKVVTQELSTTGLTLYVRFEDSKTGVSRTPQSTTRLFTLDKDNDRFGHPRCVSICLMVIDRSIYNIMKYL